MKYKIITTFYCILFFYIIFDLKLANAIEESENEDTYYLNTGDKITITVFNEPELTMDVLINTKGVIDYPLLGTIKVSKLTTEELKYKLYQGLVGRFLINPDIQVRILEYRPFYIRGEVNNPNQYSFQPGLTIEKAIAIAGGYSERAKKGKVHLIRNGKTFEKDIMDSVIPGDIIRVKTSYF